ncbi:hypothetical protein GQ457_06G025370 [Hibiscus cannabinus]
MSEPVDLSDNSRLPKKQRRRDEAPPDTLPPTTVMDCDGNESSSHPPSYKDMLTSGSDQAVDVDLVSLDDDDIDLLEDDVQTGEADGIPFIVFSDRVKDLAIKSMDFTLILKVLGRRVGYTTLFNRITGIWKPTHQIKLIDIENDYFLVKFSSSRFQPAAGSPKPYHGLGSSPWPSHHMVVKIDYQTDYGRRGRFARMAVKINLQQPLVSKISINGQIQCVEYESLPIVCFKCGTYGHDTDLCPLAKGSESETAVQPPPSARPKTIPSDPFGPWMLVERRQRRQPWKETLPETPVVAPSPQGSRFNPIFMDDPAADDFGHPPASSATLQHVQTTTPNHIPSDIERAMPPHDATTVLKENAANHKSKGKRPQSVRKPPAVVLAPKNPNILPRKPSPSLPSSSRLPKGRTVSAVLNPAKHGAVVISLESVPIFLSKTPLMEMHPTGASTSLADKRLNATAGVDAENMPLPDIIRSFTLAASNWNREVFGLLGRSKRILLARLRGVQRCLDQKRTKGLLKLEQKLLTELESVLDHEEQLWKQKARMDWIQFGDRNTRYFHAKAISRRRRSNITCLKIGSGEWCDDNAQLRVAATAFFSSLFAVTDSPPVPAPIDPVVRVSDMVSADGSWDWTQLQCMVSSHAIESILNVVPPSPLLGPDRYCWLDGQKHIFSVKSAYTRLCQDSWDAENPCWKFVWKLSVPERIRGFIWLALCDKLLSNVVRCRRGLSHDASCSACCDSEESLLHILRGCPLARAVWDVLPLGLNRSDFYTLPYMEWFLENLRCSTIVAQFDCAWNILFVTVAWQLWKRRCTRIFSGEYIGAQCLIQLSVIGKASEDLRNPAVDLPTLSGVNEQ